MFDLPGYILSWCLESGVTEVSSSPADTYAEEERFFSYRRSSQSGDPNTGRLISAIMLAE